MDYKTFKSKWYNKGVDVDGFYSFQCLTGEYLVKLSDGSYKYVKDLREGDKLSTGNTVVNNEPKQSTVYWLNTSQGWFKVSKDHKVFLADGSYKAVTDLKRGETIALDYNESKKVYDLTDDELKFFGFWLGDGSLRNRWKNSKSPTVFLTVGTENKLNYVKGLDINCTFHKHSNRKADIINLQVRHHPELLKVIKTFSDKGITDVFTKEQYLHIIEGYLEADGHKVEGSNTNVATSVNKQLLVTLQHGCHLNGISACLGKKQDRKATNYSSNPKPLWRLSVNKNRNLLNNFISLEEIGEDIIYVLNTDGDHSYYADNHLHHNCWDSFAQWCRENGVPVINTTPVSQGGSGYAKDLWEKKASNGILKHFDEVPISQLQEGDVAVFKEVQGWTPVSHVALFDRDIDGKYGYFLSQNQGGINGVHNLCRFPYSTLYPTAFRLKKANNNQGGSKTVALPVKNIGGEIFSGVITGYDANIMNCDSNRTKIDRIVIHHNATTNDAVARSTWYVSSGHGTSAHYQVTPDKIWGCVGENYVAYHAGNYPVNQRSIGIEHLNNTGAPTWTIAEETYRNSARLIRDICERYNIPIDRQHILKHGEVSSTACPGGIDIDRLVAMAKGADYVTPAKATPKPSAPGKMQKAYRVDDLKFVNGLWQVYCQDLAPAEFNWTDNGIAVEDIIITNKDGARLPDQMTHVGDYFVFDQTATADTGYGAMGSGGWYWRKFRLRTSGEIWLSAWNLNHLLFG